MPAVAGATPPLPPMTLAEHPVLVVMIAAAAAPLLAELPSRVRLPVVVLEVVLGVLLGPHVLGWLVPAPFVQMMFSVGMAAVLFMAGLEIDFARIRGRPLALALTGWLLSLAIGLVAVAVLHVVPGVHAPLMVTLALATTGLGVLLPLLRDGGQLDTPYGRMLLAAGTVGEVGPILLVSLLLSQRYGTTQAFGYLVVFLVLIALAALVGMAARPPRLLALLERTLHSSTQLPVRLVGLILAGAVVLSEEMGFEGVLGAFAAGMVVGLATRGPEAEVVRTKFDAVAFGWLTPFFFIGTGMSFDLPAMFADLTTILLLPSFVGLLLLIRGLPVWLYRRDLPAAQRQPFALLAAVPSLGLVVVITEIGLRTKVMIADVAQALIGAALLATLLYPTLAALLAARGGRLGRMFGASRS